MKNSLKFNSTLKEILDHCAVPNAIVERKELLLDASHQFPGFIKFIEYAFGTPTEDFLKVLEDFPPQQPMSKVPNRQETIFDDFFLTHLPKHKGLKRLDIMRSKLVQEMDFLEPRDFELILPALRGEFAYDNPKINEVVLAMAFPQVFPN